MIELKNVNKSYHNQLIFNDLNLKIDKCGFYAVVGESGCGKTTLLSIIAKSEGIDEGTVKLEGTISQIYQNYELIDELNVKDNISLLNLEDDKFNDIVNKLRIRDILNFYPKELSGGQRQRVGIARAIYFDPDIILCDEPTDSLDLSNKVIVLNYLKELSKTKIIICVSHDISLIEKYADVIYELKNHNLNRKIINTLKVDHIPNKVHKDIKLYNIISKINKHKNIILSIIINLVFVIFAFVFVWSVDKLYVEDHNHILNINQVYLKDSIDNKIINELSNIEPIVEFKECIFENKNLDVQIYPLVLNDNFNYPTLSANELVINQNLDSLLDINDELILKYATSDGIKMDYFKVVSMIEEDTSLANIYYDLKAFKTSYNSEKMAVIDNSYRQGTIDYKRIDELYEMNQKSSSYSDIYSPTYEMNKSISDRNNLYRIFLYSFSLVYVMVVVLIISVYFTKDNHAKIKTYALLLVYNNNRGEIIKNHIKNKWLYLILFSLINILITTIMVYSKYSRISTIDILIIVLFNILIMMTYILSMRIGFSKFKQTNIQRILKKE